MAVVLDLDSLTLGEIMEAERQSGVDGSELLSRPVHRRALAVFVDRWRTFGQPPSWQEVESLRLLDVLSSTSASSQGSPSETSPD